MAEKNQLFVTYTGVVEFVGKKSEKVSKNTGEKYWLRDFAVRVNDTNPKYPVTLVFNLMGKKVPLVDGLERGMDVVITFTLNSKSYTTAEGETKYFLSLNLISATTDGSVQTTGMPDMGIDDDTQDLPF